MTEPLSYDAITGMIEARRRLQKMVEAKVNSFEVQDFAKRHRAGKKAWAMRQAARAGRASHEARSGLHHTATIAIATVEP